MLLLVTVNSKCGPAVLSEVFSEIVCNTLCADENEDLAVLLGNHLEMLDELASLLEFRADLDHLGDVGVGGKIERSDGDLHEVVQVVVGESLNLLGPGSREHECLSVGSDLVDNLSDLWLETHVKHSVCLVHD